MSDKMEPIRFENLVKWIISEYKADKTIFGIPMQKFYRLTGRASEEIFGELLESPVGPAAGPHTQLTQNIIAAYLTGGRFFELKTVQTLDDLKIDKPCIDASDEGYNVEWSQELSLDQSYAEYVKAWILIHLLKNLLGLSDSERGFVFNMSVGYDLEGIMTGTMDRFIEELKDASKNGIFAEYKEYLLGYLVSETTIKILQEVFGIPQERLNLIISGIGKISPFISNSVTLSTMHGCPPREIESIVKYLLCEKGLHTFVKLNPTLLGYDFTEKTLRNLGFKYIDLPKSSFDRDLQYGDAIPMLRRLREFAVQNGKIFGVKLTNTLGVKNTIRTLPGDDMYMSGRSLFPLAINLASKLAAEFEGDLNISYSGGADAGNIKQILSAGIKPVTLATDLLKPGGYSRLTQISEIVANVAGNGTLKAINLPYLASLAGESLAGKKYLKESREIKSIKIGRPLPVFDCFIAPCQEACPIHQDVASYIGLVEMNKFAEAYELIISKNPLPHITGYICDHQCTYHCTRWDYDEPVLIRDLKKEAALNGYDSYMAKFAFDATAAENRIKVAVIGAGPSGLATSYFLAKAGFDVTIFEKEADAGGIVKNILPQFRLPEEAIKKDIEFIEKHGIRIKFGANADFSIEGLKKNGYKYIYISIGAELSNKSDLQAESGIILNAIDLLKDYRSAMAKNLGKTVAVIGGGNSAMDSARAAIRYKGVGKVYLIYRRTVGQMPADKEEFYAALGEGVEFKELLLPEKFDGNILTCRKMKLGESGKDGRLSVEPLPDQTEEIQIDSVISAIGEHVDKEFLQRNRIRMAHNKVVVNGNNETVIENVFIGGDALRGPSTIVESIADSRKAADAIIGKEYPGGIKSNDAAPVEAQHSVEDIIARKGKIIHEIKSDLHLESSRCLACNVVCNKCIEVCPNRANVAVRIETMNLVDRNQIFHLDALCNECGNCETFCPYQGAPYKEKPTLFKDEEAFMESDNNGFFIHSKDHELTAVIRWKNERGTLVLDENGVILRSSIHDPDELNILAELIRNIEKDYSYLIP